MDGWLARLTLQFIDSATRSPECKTSIKFGAIGVRGAEGTFRAEDLPPTATIAYSLQEEADTIRWPRDEVEVRGELPLLEAESVVKSLSVAMHGDREIVISLLDMKEFDQYTTTHSLNVSVLAMVLSEYMGMGSKDVRGFGVAGLPHDLGQVRIPREVLTKPGKLTEEEVSRAFIRIMGQWERRVAVVGDKTALPQYAAAMLEANRERAAAAMSAAASAAAAGDVPPPATTPAMPDCPQAPA